MVLNSDKIKTYVIKKHIMLIIMALLTINVITIIHKLLLKTPLENLKEQTSSHNVCSLTLIL